MSHLDGGSAILPHQMPSNNQHSNPMSQSMLWGRSDMKEKFYSGSSASNPWVRDLLWKRCIVDEKKLQGHDAPGSNPMDKIPPHMRSVHAATLKAERALKIQKMEQKKAEKLMAMKIREEVLYSGRGEPPNMLAISLRKRPATVETSRSTNSMGVARRGRLNSRGGVGSKRDSRGSAKTRHLPSLNLEKLGNKNGKPSSRRSSSRMSSRSLLMNRKMMALDNSVPKNYVLGTNRSSYSRASSRRSMRSSSSVSKLATLLRDQNNQLRMGLAQQVGSFFSLFFSLFFFLLSFLVLVMVLLFFIFFYIIVTSDTVD